MSHKHLRIHSTESHALSARDSDLTSRPVEATKPAIQVAPDGGARAWFVVFGAWCTSVCSFGWVNSAGVFQEYYQLQMLKEYSASQISWIPSVQIFLMFGTGPVVGMIIDKYGPRYLLLGGSFLHVLGLMMTSISSKYYQVLLAQGFCSGLGMAAIFQPAIACVLGWFDKKKGAAFGILFTGSSIGGIVFPIMIARLVSEVGFGWTLRISAFIILVLLAIANIGVQPFTPPKPRAVTRAQLMKPFTEPDFMLLTAGCFCFSFGFFPPLNFLQVEASATGTSQRLVSYLLAIVNAASLFGRLFSGFMGDKLGRYNIFVVVCYISGILILGLWLPSSTTAAIVAFAVLFGFFSGAFAALISPLVMQISSIAEIGFRSGIVMFFMAIGGLTSNPISGAIIDSPGGWKGMKVFAGVFCLVGTTFVLMVKMRRTEWKLLARF